MRIDLVAKGAKNIQGKTGLNADLESGRSLVSHPRRKAGKGAVKLVHNEKRGAASLKPPPNAYRLAEARMKSVGDACFCLLFVGSMSPFRARPGSHECRCSARAGAWRSCAAACAAPPNWTAQPVRRPCGRRD